MILIMDAMHKHRRATNALCMATGAALGGRLNGNHVTREIHLTSDFLAYVLVS
jgi:hypothetical protein